MIDAMASAARAMVEAGTAAPLTITLVPVAVPPGRGGYEGKIPPRMKWLHPGAAEAYKAIAHAVVVTDMYRSATASLAAMQKKRGVLPPGFSRHGYGLAIDLDVSETMRMHGLVKKAGLDAWMAGLGWTCHRLDHLNKIEQWHWNWLNGFAVLPRETSSRAAGERQLASMYRASWVLTPKEEQRALAKLHIYSGAIDGKLGPLSAQGKLVFCRAWKCSTANYHRVLAFVSADLRTPDGGIIDIRSGTVAAPGETGRAA